jgi:lysophospholipase L1-like esterase
VLVCFFMLGALEAGLRLLGYPKGTFSSIDLAAGLYPPNAAFTAAWGPIPYAVRSNSLGLRGPEIERRKPSGSFRIATLGDSVTDGFFVDNDGMWQHFLQQALNAAPGRHVEVLSCARGGGSIGRALAAWRECASPLSADLVILTFATNDIADVVGKTRTELLSETLKPHWRARLHDVFFYRTATGEFLLDRYLRVMSPSYRQRDEYSGALTADRYRIRGGDLFKENAYLFNARFPESDGLVLQGTLGEEARQALDSYFHALSELVGEVQGRAGQGRAGKSNFLFVYFPAYSQIYGDAPTTINQSLRSFAERQGIDYLDLTATFQREAGKVLHLAPVDYHLNPEGNRVFASGVAQYINDNWNRLARTEQGGDVR